MELTRSQQLFRARVGWGTAALLVALVAVACAPAPAAAPTAAPATKPAAAASPSPALKAAASPAPAAKAVPSPSPALKAAASPSPAAEPRMLTTRLHPSLRSILTDGQGRTLYLFTRDEPDTSTCSGDCLQTWPPLLVNEQPSAGPGTNASLVGTITREDGSMQVTYNRLPVYYYAADQQPGDVNGQGVGDVWFVVNPQGEAVRT